MILEKVIDKEKWFEFENPEVTDTVEVSEKFSKRIKKTGVKKAQIKIIVARANYNRVCEELIRGTGIELNFSIDQTKHGVDPDYFNRFPVIVTCRNGNRPNFYENAGFYNGGNRRQPYFHKTGGGRSSIKTNR